MGFLFLMKINSSKQYTGPNFPHHTRIRAHHTDRLAFNFSFLTKDSKHNLNKNSKTINKRVRLKLLERISQLSQDDIIVVLGYDKHQGLEKMPESEVRINIHPEFKSSKRIYECEDDFWVFQLAKQGRVIGKKNNNIFYIMSVDASFKQYNHGS